jgi:hypothetical protein
MSILEIAAQAIVTRMGRNGEAGSVARRHGGTQ